MYLNMATKNGQTFRYLHFLTNFLHWAHGSVSCVNCQGKERRVPVCLLRNVYLNLQLWKDDFGDKEQ